MLIWPEVEGLSECRWAKRMWIQERSTDIAKQSICCFPPLEISSWRLEGRELVSGAKLSNLPFRTRNPNRRKNVNPTILSVAYPFAPVGVDSCGGAEQIVSLLDRALTREGWRSVVVARADSRVCGTFVGSGIPNGEVSVHSRQQVWQEYRKIVAQAIQNYRPDVIHMHGVDFDSYLPTLDRPILVTLHLPLTWYPKELFTNESHNLVLQCVSQPQAASTGVSALHRYSKPCLGNQFPRCHGVFGLWDSGSRVHAGRTP